MTTDNQKNNQEENQATPSENTENQTSSENNQFSDAIVEKIKNLESENKNLKDKLLRTVAEVENIRKRTQKQIEEAAKFSTTNFTKDLFNVAENLKRAVQSINPQEIVENQLLKNIYTGIEMTHTELMNVFSKNNITIISPSRGDDFDHNLHQAVSNAPSEDIETGKIIQVLQDGFMLHDRLLRPAMVITAAQKSQ